MFFIGGFGQKEEFLNFNQLMICKNCGQYGQVKVIMVYSYLSFFFIPLFKWNKRYFVQMNCCNATCEINKEIGREIERGTITELNENMLHFQNQPRYKQCSNCGYTTQENFAFCPRCGNRL